MTSCGWRPSVWDREANHKLRRCWRGVYFYGWCRYGQSLYLQRNRGRWMLSNSIWMRSCTPFQAEISVDTTIMAQHHTLSPTLTHLPGLSIVNSCPPPWPNKYPNRNQHQHDSKYILARITTGQQPPQERRRHPNFFHHKLTSPTLAEPYCIPTNCIYSPPCAVAYLTSQNLLKSPECKMPT